MFKIDLIDELGDVVKLILNNRFKGNISADKRSLEVYLSYVEAQLHNLHQLVVLQELYGQTREKKLKEIFHVL